MSQKRKYEEYHDPDYPQATSAKRECTKQTFTNPAEKIEKIRLIIMREFQKEVAAKEQNIIEIDNRISIVRKLLHKVRYAVVSHYYNKQNITLNTEDMKLPNSLFENDVAQKLQFAYHPSIKRILGTSIDEYTELLKIREPRQAATTAKTTIKEKLKTKKERRLDRLRLQRSNHKTNPAPTLDTKSSASSTDQITSPRNQPITKLNIARGGNQIRHLIVVGNTSKFIGGENAASKITHKWLVYVQTKTANSIEELVAKVRFFLHPSYKPNDVIDVNSPPFQLSRRGWGEFPVRLQLIFHPKLQQKPVQLVHNLILDKKLTGFQTMGAETLVEIWLRSGLVQSSVETNTPSQIIAGMTNHKKNTTSKDQNLMKNRSVILSPMNEKNLMDFLDQIETTSISSDIDNIEPSLLLSPNNLQYLSDMITSKTKSEFCPEITLNNFNFNYPDIFESLDGISKVSSHLSLPQNIQTTNTKLYELGIDNVNIKSDRLFTDSDEIEYKTEKEPVTFKMENDLNHEYISPVSSAISAKCKTNKTTLISAGNRGGQVFLKNGKMYIIDPLQSKYKSVPTNCQQQSLLKPQISLLKPLMKTSINSKKYPVSDPWLLDHDYTPKRSESIINYQKDLFENNIRTSLHSKVPGGKHNFNSNHSSRKIGNIKNVILMQKPRKNYRKEFEDEFQKRIFVSEIRLVEYLLKTVPLVNRLAIQSDYKISFPFVVHNLDIYENLIDPKRKACEWLQSKYFSTLMAQNKMFKESAWSTKEIILFARSHGYTPSSPKNIPTTLVSQLLTTEASDSVTGTTNSSFNEIYDWIVKKRKEVNAENRSDCDEIINVDEYVPDCGARTKNVPITQDCNNKTLWMGLNEKYEEEAVLVSNMCFEIGIRLEPEKLAKGVMHESSKLVLIQAMRFFIEDLVRKSISKQCEMTTNDGLHGSGSSSGPLISQHIKAAILTNSRFDFLTNRNLCISKTIKSDPK